MTETRRISMQVNGKAVEADASVRVHLADFLRAELGLTGTHIGCEHGVCGACTLLVDGEAVRSCLMLAVQAHGSEVQTVEGLGAPDGTLHPLQDAFAEKHGLQCGFCTPGMLMSLAAFLEENPAPTEEEVRESISGISAAVQATSPSSRRPSPPRGGCVKWR